MKTYSKFLFAFLDIPALQKHRFPLFIDDAEPAVHLAVRMQAPNLVINFLMNYFYRI